MKDKLSALKNQLDGLIYFEDSGFDNSIRIVYSTDASVYQEKPLAVVLPATKKDISALIRFAKENQLTLIPRAAGTSLAGQVVGNGIVVDISAGWDKIIELNTAEKWILVQPGIIRDDLNKYLQPYGLMFGPETSTASRAMVGGMVGNNSCGLHSIVWGSARDHLLEATVLLSDGSEVLFKDLTLQEFQQKLDSDSDNAGTNLEREIYRKINGILEKQENRDLITRSFPKKTVVRRNTGYALDSLIDATPFKVASSPNSGNTGASTETADISKPFNFCKLLAGSEGTLCFFTALKIQLIDLPPKHNALLCLHFHSIRECLVANVVVMQAKPAASELTDKRILDFTKGHPVYSANRFFIEGDPEAILMVEFFADDPDELTAKTGKLILDLQSRGLGYAWPVLSGDEAKLAWDIRKAGLGLLRNLPGDTQPVNLIEDCAVSVEDLPDYADDVAALLKRHGLSASYYAHAGAGELHIEPMINLKQEEGRSLFRQVLAETVQLVKKYNGSLSGEHGDGRLRGEFIPTLMGAPVYDLFRQVKYIFDPSNIFNSGKIVDTPAMDANLRYQPTPKVTGPSGTPAITSPATIFSFSKQESILRLAEKCSGSGDCRKTHLSGGTMCPSYMATRQEKDTTRARANILRHYLTNTDEPNPFDHHEIKAVMDLCLSCKGCKTECPSAVDVAKMKAEFLQHYYDANGTPFRTRMIGNFTRINRLASLAPAVYNFFLQNKTTASILKNTLGFSTERSLPLLHKQTLRSWFRQWQKTKPAPHPANEAAAPGKKIYLFADEFTNYNDVEMGQKAIQLLSALGYDVHIPDHDESGRTYLSKGLLYSAKKIAIGNVKKLYPHVKDGTPLIGLEPSAILTLRDEYPDLVSEDLLDQAKTLAGNSFYIDEFLAAEIKNQQITSNQFTTAEKQIHLHGHCHQKALSALSATVTALSLPANYKVELIPSGCCGMAGSFGYEKEHYSVSMNIGELVLFPAVRSAADSVTIAAPGTSCRHQIKDGTGKTALHPVEILWDALKKPQ